MGVVIAIVPAAGLSRRMGRPKLLLPLAGQPMLAYVLTALVRAGVERTLVVLPPGADELLALVRGLGAEPVELDASSPDMRASVTAGLDRAARFTPDAAPDAFLVTPADLPALSPRVVSRLIAAFRAQPPGGARIVVPTHAGRRGHPVLFGWELADAVRRLPTGHGLNRLVADLSDRVHELPVDERGVLEDIDTPDDYDRARGAASLPEEEGV